MNINDIAHPHHATWKEHLLSVLSGEPKTVQVKASDDDNGWLDIDIGRGGVALATWQGGLDYRIKPAATRTVTYPEPMKTAPTVGTPYWSISPLEDAYYTVWSGSSTDKVYLLSGMCWATRQEAKQAACAIFKIKD